MYLCDELVVYRCSWLNNETRKACMYIVVAMAELVAGLAGYKRCLALESSERTAPKSLLHHVAIMLIRVLDS